MTGSMFTSSLVAASLIATTVAATEPTSKDVRRATAFQNWGSQALESNNLAKAKKYFDQAIAILPYYSEAHFGLGHLAMREQRFEDALEEYRLALASYGQAGDIRLRIQAIQYEQAQEEIHRLRDALLELQRPSPRMPTDDMPHGNMMDATNLERQIRQLEEIALPTSVSAQDPPGEAHFHVGNALFRLNRLDEAVQEWETCIRKSPDFPIVYNNLAVIYWKQGKIADAERSLARAESLGFPVRPEFKSDLARSAAQRAPNVQPPAPTDMP